VVKSFRSLSFFVETKYDDANIHIAMQECTCNVADVADQARLACIATFQWVWRWCHLDVLWLLDEL